MLYKLNVLYMLLFSPQNSCRNYHLLLKVKQLVVWLCHALRGYGFPVDKLYEVLLEIRFDSFPGEIH